MESSKENVQEVDVPTGDFCPFLELPPEMILRICDFLDSETVIKVLGKVCQFFALLAAENLIWRTRIHKRWPGKRYPPVEASGEFDWKVACIERENEYRKWCNIDKHVARTELMFGFCVDVVHITANDHLLVGLRDHTFYSYKLTDIPAGSNAAEVPQATGTRGLETFQNSTHKGWIWTISSDEQKLCTGSWDSKVMLWDYSGKQTASYSCKTAVLCSTMTGNEIFAGTSSKMLVKIDSRVASPVSITRAHTRPILCMQETDRWIIAGGESKIINIIDKKTLKICSTTTLSSGYPRSMSLVGSLVYVGSKSGEIHIYSFDESLGVLTFVETFPCSHTGEVRSVKQTLGSVLSASKDGYCKIWEPSGSPSLLHSIQSSQADEICSMDYRNGSLVLGTAVGCVSLYRDQSSSL